MGVPRLGVRLSPRHPILEGFALSHREDLRDRSGVLLGTRVQSGPYIVGHDRQNRIVGRYDPHRNQTWDRNNRLVGHGDLLNGLILENQ